MAEQRILDEQTTERVGSEHATDLPAAYDSVARYAEAFLGDPGSLSAELREGLLRELDDEQILELTLFAAVAFGMSRLIIALGAEPASMPTSIVPVERVVAGTLWRPAGQ